VANAEMLAPIARAGVKDEPAIDFHNIIIYGSVRYPSLVKQRQSGEASGCSHLGSADPAASQTVVFICSSSSSSRRFDGYEREHRRVERLEELGASNAGFAKEIHHLLTRVAKIEKHLGIDKKIAA
jgi:hypothetical protein